MMKECGNENVLVDDDINTEVKMSEIIVGKDDKSEKGCDPDVTCTDIVTVISHVCNDTTSTAEDDVNDALALRVHFDKCELTKLSRLRIYLESKRKNILWIVFVFIGTLLTLRTVRLFWALYIF